MVYLDRCPSCQCPIPEPFVRGSVLYYRHHNGREHCDLIAAIHPLTDDHVLEVVPSQESYEETMERVVEGLTWGTSEAA